MEPGSEVDGYAGRRYIDAEELRYLAENYDSSEAKLASHRLDKTPLMLTDDPEQEEELSEILGEELKLEYRSGSILDEPDAYEIQLFK